MTSLFQARRSAEEFAAAVDGGAENRAPHSPELTTLLQLVATMRDQPPVAPRPEFAGELRSRLMREAETALQPETANLLLPSRPRGRRERRLVAAASAFVLIGGTTTMAAAAQSSLPGDALYPIKRSIESAEARLSTSNAGKGKDLLHQANDRLTEVKGLVAADTVQGTPRVPETLAAFSDSADQGSRLLFESFRENGDPQSIVEVRSFTTQGISQLEALADTVPADAQDELAAAAILLHDIDGEAASLCGTCASDLPSVEVPGIFLAHAEADRALALAATSKLQNSHPVVVHKDTFTGADAPQAALPSESPSAPAGEAPTPGAAIPSPNLSPSDWPSLLPGLGGASGTKGTDSSTDSGGVGDLGKKVDSGLTDVVKTLLPDTGGLLD
ncbi:MAG TPA: DUF5667 domain-containing protein [Nocardioidaceae bacterium]|nr:DUF5667 domain-containing protein [Nocardioidaceae bacterium]